MAHSIAPELHQEFMDAVLAACPSAQWAGSGAICAFLEEGDRPPPDDPVAAGAELRARLERNPDDLEVLCALDRLHGERSHLIGVLQRRFELAVDHDEQWKLLMRLGLLYGASGDEGGVRSTIAALGPLRQEHGTS